MLNFNAVFSDSLCIKRADRFSQLHLLKKIGHLKRSSPLPSAFFKNVHTEIVLFS